MNEVVKYCPESESTLILYLYGEAENPEAFETHLSTCPVCRAELESHRNVLTAYRRSPEDDYIEAEAVVESLDSRRSSRRVTYPVAAALMAAAAVIAIMVSLKFRSPAQDDAPGFMTDRKIEQPLDNMEAALDDIMPQEKYAYEEDFNSLDELDGMLAELGDIRESLETF